MMAAGTLTRLPPDQQEQCATETENQSNDESGVRQLRSPYSVGYIVLIRLLSGDTYSVAQQVLEKVGDHRVVVSLA